MLFACRLRTICVAPLAGFSGPEVASTWPKPTISFVMPLTVPVNIRFASGARKSSWFKMFVPSTKKSESTLRVPSVSNPAYLFLRFVLVFKS